MGKYEGKDNYGIPKSKYVKKVEELSREDLLKETSQKIWLSAYANNNPRSDYHWHVDVCYDEWLKRDGNANGYEEAYKQSAVNV